jgi:hypothetical protein
MPMFTYISDHNRKDWTSVKDNDINELLQEVREKFDNNHLVQEREFTTKKWLRKPVTTTLYDVYYGKGMEVQCINFCSDSESSINPMVSKAHLANFLMGMLNGFDYKVIDNREVESVMNEFQESEDEQENGYQLKTDEEIIDMICEFGNGETEFHTVDINRLIVDNRRMKEKLGIT